MGPLFVQIVRRTGLIERGQCWTLWDLKIISAVTIYLYPLSYSDYVDYTCFAQGQVHYTSSWMVMKYNTYHIRIIWEVYEYIYYNLIFLWDVGLFIDGYENYIIFHSNIRDGGLYSHLLILYLVSIFTTLVLQIRSSSKMNRSKFTQCILHWKWLMPNKQRNCEKQSMLACKT